MDGSNSMLSRPKREEKSHVYELFGLEQPGSIEYHCETMEEFSEEDICGDVNYDAEAEMASVKILEKESCHEENNGRRLRYESSAPVNIPNWSQMVRKLKKNEKFGGHGTVDDGDERDFERIPPHEFINRQLDQSEIASFSVYEGVGRTLKGRDLRQVRYGIWTRTGFLK